MNHWVYQQEPWTKLLEEISERCLEIQTDVFSVDDREFEKRDAAILLAHLILLDAASKTWSNNSAQNESLKKEAQKRLLRTVRSLLRGCDQEHYLQALNREINKHFRTGSLPFDTYREIIFIATAKEPHECTPFVSELVIRIEDLSDETKTRLEKIGKFGNFASRGRQPRLNLPSSGDKEKPKSIPTRAANRRTLKNSEDNCL